MIKRAKEGMKQNASQLEIYGRMHAVFVEMDSTPPVTSPPLVDFVAFGL